MNTNSGENIRSDLLKFRIFCREIYHKTSKRKNRRYSS